MKKTEAKKQSVPEMTQEQINECLDQELNRLTKEILKILGKKPEAGKILQEYEKAKSTWTGEPYDKGRTALPYWSRSVALEMMEEPEYLKYMGGLENVIDAFLETDQSLTVVLKGYDGTLKEYRKIAQHYPALLGAWKKLDPPTANELGPMLLCEKGREFYLYSKMMDYIIAHNLEEDPKKSPDEYDLAELETFRKEYKRSITVSDGEIVQKITELGKDLDKARDQLPNPTRGSVVYDDNTKVGYMIGQKFPKIDIDKWTLKTNVLVDSKKTKVPIEIKMEYNRPIEPYDIMIQGAIGSIIENSLKKAGNDPSLIKIYPATIYRVLADLPDETPNKNNTAERPRDVISKDVSDKDIQEIIERVDKLMATTGSIDVREQKKNWTKLKKIKSDVLTGQLFRGLKYGTRETYLKNGKPVLDKDGKPKERWTGVYYIPDNYPLIYQYGKWTEQILTMERGTLDTTAKGVKGLKNPDGTDFQPIRNTRDNTILKKILYEEVKNMERERDESGTYENRRTYETLLNNTYGEGRPDAKKEGKSLITFKKNVGLILNFFRASGIIKDWKKYPEGGKTTKVNGVKIYLNPPQDPEN